MLNQVVLVGRLVKDPELKELESGKNVTNITLAIPRSYKNVNGEYDTDFIDCVLWENTAKATTEYCKKGDIIGVKGRMESYTHETEEGKNKKETRLIAEKVTFLSSASKEKEDKDNEI